MGMENFPNCMDSSVNLKKKNKKSSEFDEKRNFARSDDKNL